MLLVFEELILSGPPSEIHVDGEREATLKEMVIIYCAGLDISKDAESAQAEILRAIATHLIDERFQLLRGRLKAKRQEVETTDAETKTNKKNHIFVISGLPHRSRPNVGRIRANHSGAKFC